MGKGENSLFDQIVGEIAHALNEVIPETVEKLADMILAHRRIFVAGAGRSGMMMKAFSMRLMHLGLETYVVGETVTPAIIGTDLLVIGSGSGETASIISMASKAHRLGACLSLVTMYSNSAIGRLADYVIVIEASTPKGSGLVKSIQPMGSLFEQCLLIIMDLVVLQIMEFKKMKADDLYLRHANLE